MELIIFYINTFPVSNKMNLCQTTDTLEPLFFGVQIQIRVSYPNHVISRVKCIGYIGNVPQIPSNIERCSIQNRVVMNHVIKRLRCNLIFRLHFFIK